MADATLHDHATVRPEPHAHPVADPDASFQGDARALVDAGRLKETTLARSALARLAGVVALLAALWACVYWALS